LGFAVAPAAGRYEARLVLLRLTLQLTLLVLLLLLSALL
jgi:hypothetical protein